MLDRVVKLCTKGSCCPTLQVDFEEETVIFIDDDLHVSKLSCANYEQEYRNTNFDALQVVVLEDPNSECPARITPDEYKLSWREYWRMKSDWLAVPTL